jgi:hypothetical protein
MKNSKWLTGLHFAAILFFSQSSFSQQNMHADSGFSSHPKHDAPISSHSRAHGMKGSHRLTLGLGHAHLSQGKVEGRTQWLPVASWSLNYDYWLSDKWAIGLQNDWILETFVVEHGDGKELERKNPLVIVPVGMYKFAPRWSAVAGAGVEYSEGHSLGLTRVGVEYGWHLPKNWEAGVAVVWDNRWGYFNAWVLSFTFSKIWPKKVGH